MANNRMVLVCGVCNLGISMAKYYPSSIGPGWGTVENVAEKLDTFFARHDRAFDEDFRVVLENTPAAWEYEHHVSQEELKRRLSFFGDEGDDQ